MSGLIYRAWNWPLTWNSQHAWRVCSEIMSHRPTCSLPPLLLIWTKTLLGILGENEKKIIALLKIPFKGGWWQSRCWTAQSMPFFPLENQVVSLLGCIIVLFKVPFENTNHIWLFSFSMTIMQGVLSSLSGWRRKEKYIYLYMYRENMHTNYCVKPWIVLLCGRSP